MGKIDLSKLTGALKGFGALRAYSVLLWPGVIILVSVGVMAAALMMGSSFKRKADKESLPLANQVKKLLDNSVAAGQAEVEGRYEEAYQADANKIARLSKESTQREPLSYDIFPEPKDKSSLLFTRFGNKFCQQIDGLTKKVNGQDCPGEEELKASLQKSGVGARMPGRIPGAGAGEESRIIEEICQARAKAASVYVNPTGLGGYDFWGQYKYSNIETGVKDCWYWQLGYWIIEDIFSTVGELNASSSSVYSSPVKRVMRAGFTTLDKLFGTSGKISQDRPKYVIKAADQLTASYTGRLSNETIDVVHFGLAVVVSSKDVMLFMKELCSAKEHPFPGYTGQDPAAIFKHNQITILESQIRSIDLTSREHQRYRYGPDSVVEVDLVCEYTFNKKGYAEIKPEYVKSDEAPKK
jgi:hypothetical protein